MPADSGALKTLQSNPMRGESPDLATACAELSIYHAPVGDQAARHAKLSASLAAFLYDISVCTPPGPERSQAISCARSAKMWASAAIALDGK